MKYSSLEYTEKVCFQKGRWYSSGHRKNSQLAIDPATGTIATSAAYAIITITVIIAKWLLIRQPEL